MNTYNVENHMVIDNESSSIEREALYKEHDDKELVKAGAEKLLNGGTITVRGPLYSRTTGKLEVTNYDFTRVIESSWDSDEFEACAKQIMLIAPHSMMGQLIARHAKKVAAEALDIDVDL